MFRSRASASRAFDPRLGSRCGCRPSSFFPGLLAALAVCSHLLVAAHTVSHLDQPLPNASSQHCALCAVGKQSVGASPAVTCVWHDIATWVSESYRLTAAAMPGVEEATLARGPPFFVRASVG